MNFLQVLCVLVLSKLELGVVKHLSFCTIKFFASNKVNGITCASIAGWISTRAISFGYSYREIFMRQFVRILIAAIMTSSLSVSTAIADTPDKTAAAGDSITMAFAANCSGNVWFWDLFCLLGADQPTRSWFDGSNRSVDSVHDKYKRLDGSITANKNAAKSGSELRGGNNNFVVQAQNIVNQSSTPDHVEVLLGGNDICNRDCTTNNCSNSLYSNGEWRTAIRNGLNILMNGLPSGSTVELGSVPRVQDLRSAGLAKQRGNWRVNCESLWNTFDVCPIATNGGTMQGESYAQRFVNLNSRQAAYNNILKQEAQAYNTNSNGRNPRGIEVISEYTNQSTSNIGTFSFGKNDINGGDCFHPSVSGQNRVANFMWQANTDR